MPLDHAGIERRRHRRSFVRPLGQRDVESEVSEVSEVNEVNEVNEVRLPLLVGWTFAPEGLKPLCIAMALFFLR